MVWDRRGYPTYVLQPGFSWQVPFLHRKQTTFVCVSGVLQDQFWPGVVYIDADSKVSVTQVGLFFFFMSQSLNM